MNDHVNGTMAGILNNVMPKENALPSVPSNALFAIAVAALKRIAACEDAPAIDAEGEWQTGLHCGVEDRNCRDRFDGADYGHTVGVEKALEWASNEAQAALDEMANAGSDASASSPIASTGLVGD